MRHRIAYLCFGLSSLFRSLGKMVRSGKTIVCDPLTLPGWFILDCTMIKQTGIKKGFQWEWWSMPEEWHKQMNKLKGK